MLTGDSDFVRASTAKQLLRIALAFSVLSTSICGYTQSMNATFIAPEKFASLAEIQEWVSSKEVRGFGHPESLEYSSARFRVFVTWNGPYSGRAGVYSNAFVLAKDKIAWRRVDASFFESPEPLADVYINPVTSTLQFVGSSGATLKSNSLEQSKEK